MKNKYDVIVIGAGNGGLAAATKILQSGKSCLLCEKHNIPGGFATSFVRGRFEFEASLHELNGIGQGENKGSTAAMFDDLGIGDKIKWYHIPNAYRIICPKDGIDFTMPVGLEECIVACDKLCENGGKYMKQYFDIAKNIADAMTYIGQMKGKPDPEVMKTKYYDYLAATSYSVDEAFEAMHFPKIIRQVLSAYWCYLGASCDELNFAHYANMSYKYFLMGAAVPGNRSHGMSIALENRIHELGGDVFFNTEVVKILTDETGHIRGVKLASGEEIATRHVIANCSPHNVYGKMMDPATVPEKALRLTNFRKFGARGFTIFLGLNKSPEELGITDHSYFIYDSCDSKETYDSMKSLEHSCAQATVCLNHVVPDAAPEGTTILYMTSLYTDDVWSKVDEKDYYKLKNKLAKGFIKKFEDATGAKLMGNIEEIAISTPQTYARYCGHPQGTIYGYESQYNDSLMARIQMVEEDVCVPGLRIGGGYGERLDGFSSSYKSGYNEAGRTLRDMAKEGE